MKKQFSLILISLGVAGPLSGSVDAVCPAKLDGMGRLLLRSETKDARRLRQIPIRDVVWSPESPGDEEFTEGPRLRVEVREDGSSVPQVIPFAQIYFKDLHGFTHRSAELVSGSQWVGKISSKNGALEINLGSVPRELIHRFARLEDLTSSRGQRVHFFPGYHVEVWRLPPPFFGLVGTPKYFLVLTFRSGETAEIPNSPQFADWKAIHSFTADLSRDGLSPERLREGILAISRYAEYSVKHVEQRMFAATAAEALDGYLERNPDSEIYLAAGEWRDLLRLFESSFAGQWHRQKSDHHPLLAFASHYPSAARPLFDFAFGWLSKYNSGAQAMLQPHHWPFTRSLARYISVHGHPADIRCFFDTLLAASYDIRMRETLGRLRAEALGGKERASGSAVSHR